LSCAGAVGGALIAGCTQRFPGVAREVVPSPSAEWRQFGIDQRNTGHHQTTVGPTDELDVAWTATLRFGTITASTVANGTVFVVDSASTVHAVAGGSGTRLWESEQPNASSIGLDDESVYVGGGTNLLYSLSRNSGEPRWSRQGADTGPHTQLTITDQRVYAVGRGGRLAAIPVDSPADSWRLDLETAVLRGAPVVANGTVYVVSRAGVHAIDPDTGTEEWMVELAPLLFGDPAYRDGTLYIAATDRLIALDIDSKTVSWERPASGGIHHSPATANDVVVAGGPNLSSFDAVTGNRLWQVDSPTAGWSSPVVVDGVVYCGLGTKLVALDLATGEQLSGFDAGVPVTSQPTVTAGIVYVVDRDGTLYAIAERELIRE